MMRLPKYSKNPEYDPKYITQLVDNFRSHPAILYFPNVQFYDGKLRAKADLKEMSFALDWKLLPNKSFPLVLHSVVANCQQEKNGFSFSNEEEVGIVKFYVEDLLENGINDKKVEIDDIGIVSPYKSQRDLLSRALKKYTGIEIGTAEYYQGREKRIIIISAVRSGYSVGFLKDERVSFEIFINLYKFYHFIILAFQCRPDQSKVLGNSRL